MSDKKELKIWTIGHSTRPLNEFLELLDANKIEVLADVRRYPGSRKYPHFNEAELGDTRNLTGLLTLFAIFKLRIE